MEEELVSGSCGCGEVTYTCDTEPVYVGNCHCRDCQKSSGSPFMTWALFKSKNVSVKSGTLKATSLTDGIKRSFCENCGSNLFWESNTHPEWIDVTLGSFDNTKYKPQSENYVPSKMEWIKVDSSIPNNAKGPFDEKS